LANQGVEHRWRFYETVAGKKLVKEFLDALSKDDAASVAAAMRDVQRNGLVSARKLDPDIYEVRADGDHQIFRILFAAEGSKGRVLLALEASQRRLGRRQWRRSGSLASG
jgi:phage-related protein